VELCAYHLIAEDDNRFDSAPDGFSQLRQPHKSLLVDSVEVEKNRKQWIAEWLRAIGR
jgi:ABC-type thiamine transport system substrate-binding protein